MKDKILIIGDKSLGTLPASSDVISDRITEKGGTCIHLALDDLVQKKCSLSGIYDSREFKILYKKNDEIINLCEEVKSVLFWRPALPSYIEDEMEGSDLEFYKAEWKNFMKGIYLNLKDCFWMNPYPENLTYQDKVYQLRLAQEIGFNIPQTFITTSLNEANTFFNQTDNEIIYKTFWKTFWDEENKKGDTEVYAIHTSIVDKKDLDDSKIKFATPNLLQTYIPKKVELRITCVGKAVMACEIQSQESEVSKVDWHDFDIKNTPHLKHKLPRKIELLCLKMLDKLGLTYGCFDMIITPENEYIFIELNPNGQYGWIERLTMLPITENIAKMLLKGSIDYDMTRW